MAKPPSFSDTALKKPLREEITKMGGDPDFIWFIIEWCGGDSRIEDFMKEKYSEAYLKRLKNKIKKDIGENWKSVDNDVKNECLRPRKKLKLKKSLFRLEPLTPNPSNRPPHYEKWLTVFYLREYFKKITGKPNMGLITKILLPHKDDKDYNPFNSEWYRRSEWFKEDNDLKTSLGSNNEHLLPIADLNGNALLSIDGLIRFYQSNQDKIIKALETGRPLYGEFMTKVS